MGIEQRPDQQFQKFSPIDPVSETLPTVILIDDAQLIEALTTPQNLNVESNLLALPEVQIPLLTRQTDLLRDMPKLPEITEERPEKVLQQPRRKRKVGVFGPTPAMSPERGAIIDKLVEIRKKRDAAEK